ncbi:STAS domain-containing protein [Pseudodesulfovibrio sp. zrk46]|uniref:STAS domain-containing protein n=1 Tax=Pseudodesulfovibrio sp. zrk46 TaxID=2725288 RepID=UPI00144A0809|nr:STAS domain-containing protein [Pseudodesulfovibrio sp. zrk46]QJB57177.1 STAS domain-containing protein [Pseudodesulfovibrio sp. zrk46]
MNTATVSIVRIKGVLLVTLPQDPQDMVIAELQDNILNRMSEQDTKGVILDLSQVSTLDSYFARTIIETGQMVSLMGGTTILAGMQVGVAITATQLGLTLGAMRTALEVDKALDMLNSTTSVSSEE